MRGLILLLIFRNTYQTARAATAQWRERANDIAAWVFVVALAAWVLWRLFA